MQRGGFARLERPGVPVSYQCWPRVFLAVPLDWAVWVGPTTKRTPPIVLLWSAERCGGDRPRVLGWSRSLVIFRHYFLCNRPANLPASQLPRLANFPGWPTSLADQLPGRPTSGAAVFPALKMGQHGNSRLVLVTRVGNLRACLCPGTEPILAGSSRNDFNN